MYCLRSKIVSMRESVSKCSFKNITVITDKAKLKTHIIRISSKSAEKGKNGGRKDGQQENLNGQALRECMNSTCSEESVLQTVKNAGKLNDQRKQLRTADIENKTWIQNAISLLTVLYIPFQDALRRKEAHKKLL